MSTNNSLPATGNRALIFAPHPDDAEIAMGAAIVKMLQDGWQVIIADITNGEPTPAGSVEIRQKETARATEIMGLTDRICLNLPNRYLENKLQYRNILAEAIRKYKPRWLFTTYHIDAHPDHTYAASLTEDARFTAKLTKTDLAYEPWYPEKIIYFYASHLRIHPDPSFVLDVSEQWPKKIEAIRAYQSQFWLNTKYNGKEPDWIIDHINTLGRYFGNRIGVKYAEPFFCHELTGLTSLNSLI